MAYCASINKVKRTLNHRYYKYTSYTRLSLSPFPCSMVSRNKPDFLAYQRLCTLIRIVVSGKQITARPYVNFAYEVKD